MALQQHMWSLFTGFDLKLVFKVKIKTLTRVDHPGITHDILSKTEMGNKGDRDELVRAKDAPMGSTKLSVGYAPRR